MHNLFLRLYVATRTRIAERPQDGFVTAEHLALAVAGVVLVGVAAIAFKSQLSGVVNSLVGNITSAGN